MLMLSYFDAYIYSAILLFCWTASLRLSDNTNKIIKGSDWVILIALCSVWPLAFVIVWFFILRGWR